MPKSPPSASQATEGKVADNEWTTVTYKKPVLTNRPVIRTKKPLNDAGRDDIKEPKRPKLAATLAASPPVAEQKASKCLFTKPTYASVATAAAGNATVGGDACWGSRTWNLKPRLGSPRGQKRRHESPEDDIQGPLPSWYKPPVWDVNTRRRDTDTEK